MGSMKPKLNISFSGGRTSGYMLKHCLEKFSTSHDITITFCNTGCEHEETLVFVDKCDRLIANGKVIWLEAVINPENGVGVSHKIVDYFTASRKGEPFEAAIRKYGIPNSVNPHCTARLKTDVMRSYLKSIGWVRGKKINYTTAIGIRADEMDRVSESKGKECWIYPLVDAGVRKENIVAWWRKQPFDLMIPGEHYGNCLWCWKKSDRKLATLAIEDPSVFTFPRLMEARYGNHMADCAAGDGHGNRMFFRKYKVTSDFKAIASTQGFVPFTDKYASFDEELDVGSACGESCEIGADQ